MYTQSGTYPWTYSFGVPRPILPSEVTNLCVEMFHPFHHPRSRRERSLTLDAILRTLAVACAPTYIPRTNPVHAPPLRTFAQAVLGAPLRDLRTRLHSQARLLVKMIDRATTNTSAVNVAALSTISKRHDGKQTVSQCLRRGLAKARITLCVLRDSAPST